jgi:polysaccharide deacetylase family protein (PEP-CTERM system associated)
MVTNALSVDVEEYYHAGIFKHGMGRVDGHGASRVEGSVDRLLELFGAHDARATFFILGEVASEHPAMVRRIASAGHEVACHGQSHEDVYRQTLRQFRADVSEAKARIEDALGAEIVGYRAPNFSIGRAQAWAYQVLIEEGFKYDSSSYPILHDRYGHLGAPRFPYEIWRSGRASLLEFPIGTVKLGGLTLPVGGGGYFRLSPSGLFHLGIRHVNATERRPIMFYLHPWELDADLPRPPMAWHHRFRLYVGVRNHAAKIDRLLARFRFDTARSVLEATTGATRPAHRFHPALPEAV